MSEVIKVAVRFRDGRVLKGITRDFLPGKRSFHLLEKESGQAVDVEVIDLKAVFFVKDFEGKPDHEEAKGFPERAPASKGRKIAALFEDGELITGYTLTYDASRPGFFMTPVDEMSNNERIYVVRAAVREVGIGLKADRLVKRAQSV